MFTFWLYVDILQLQTFVARFFFALEKHYTCVFVLCQHENMFLILFPCKREFKERKTNYAGEISFSIKREVVKEKQMCFLSKNIFGIASIFGSVF